VSKGGEAVRRCDLSVSTAFDYSITIDAQLPLVAEAGFGGISLGENAGHAGYLHPSGRAKLRTLLEEIGLRLDTIHGPNLGRVDQFPGLVAAVETAADLGCPVVVAHAGPFDFPVEELPTRLEQARSLCDVLRPTLQNCGVVLAIENVLPGPATELVCLLDRLDPINFGFCYDSAHDHIDNSAPLAVLGDLGDRLRAVHLSDRIRAFVDHVPPGDGFIDWPGLIEVLRSTGFDGPLVLEVMLRHWTDNDPGRLLTTSYQRGRWLCDLKDDGRRALSERGDVKS
jgi:sugar phosphate isomerase/epimerase